MYDSNELETFKKLAIAGNNVIISNKGSFKKGSNKNDAFIIDRKTFYNEAVEIKRITGTGAKSTFLKKMDKAGKQANVVVLDVLPTMSPR